MLYYYVPSGDQMMLGYMVTFLEEIEWCKLYCYVPSGDQML